MKSGTDATPLTIVIKLGSSSIVHPEQPHYPQLATLSAIVETCISLRNLGHRVVIVSSGAIGMGMHRMEMSSNSKRSMGEKQALAAIGQGRLIALWDQLFGVFKQPVGQVLVTRNDIADRSRYMNATTTLSTLLGLGVIPIINENDTISVSEILQINKFGDNDTLSAIAAGMCGADYLFLLTDVEGLYEDNPRKVIGARRVSVVRDIEQVRTLVSTSTLGSSLGTGGMETKLIAAELATAAGCATVITIGSAPTRILDIILAHSSHSAPSTPSALAVEFSTENDTLPPHTLFIPKPKPLTSRRFWILHGLTARGSIYIDEGAYFAISRSEKDGGGAGNGGRLLAAGVIRVVGDFAAGQAVRVLVIKGRKRVEQGSRPVSPDHFADTRGNRKSLEDRGRRKSLEPIAESGGAVDEEFLREGETVVEFGRGLSNYNSLEMNRVKGLKSSEIERVLGYIESDYLVESVIEISKDLKII